MRNHYSIDCTITCFILFVFDEMQFVADVPLENQMI